MTRLANLDLGFLFKVVCFGNHLGRPSGGAGATDADTTVATVTSPTEHGKLALANEAIRVVAKFHHLGRCIGNGGFPGLLFRREGKRFEVF